jgi:cytochrome P450
MQQQSEFRSPAFAFFRPRTLEEISQTYSWFAEMQTRQPVFYDEGTQLWQVFRYEDVTTVLTDYDRFSSQPLARFAGGSSEAH